MYNMTITSDDIYALLRQGESASVEIKKCSDSLPRSVWETYSAFANTRGGVILLGIAEHKDRPLESRYEITGVSDSEKVETDFFNMLNNRQKVSRNILFDSDFRPVEVDGKIVIYITVPEADYHKKPIYINDNLVDGSFKRSHEGDRRINREELAMMLRDSTDDIDSQILEHYDMADIDEETLRGYRQVFNTSNPGHAYKSLDNKDFLYRMGGYDYDRHKGIEGLTLAGLMMFGKGTPIEKRFPLFRMDYLDLMGVVPGGDLKWNDRLTYDGRWENNLYNFVTMTMRKLLFTLPSEGRIVGPARRDGGPLFDGVREAIINSVTYSDFQTEGVLRIDRRDNEIILRNPGLLRIAAERIYNGDFTHARNRNIQKMFRMIGYGDNIGSGFQKILAAWKSLGFKRPKLEELDDVNEVWLTLPLVESHETVSTANDSVNEGVNDSVNVGVNNDNSASVGENVGEKSEINISGRQKDIIDLIKKSPTITAKQLSEILSVTSRTVERDISSLKDMGILSRKGTDKSGEWILQL